MRYTIDPGRKRPSVNFIDSIVYSRRPDLDGNMLDLEMSIMLQNGNSEMRMAAGCEEIFKARHSLGSRRRIPGRRQKPDGRRVRISGGGRLCGRLHVLPQQRPSQMAGAD